MGQLCYSPALPRQAPIRPAAKAATPDPAIPRYSETTGNAVLEGKFFNIVKANFNNVEVIFSGELGLTCCQDRTYSLA